MQNACRFRLSVLQALNSRFIFSTLLLLLISTQTINAVENISFDIETIVTHNWQIKDVKISLYDLHKDKQQFSAAIKQLVLPKPFSKLQIIDITCQFFSWQKDKIICQKGKARLKSSLISKSPFKFSFFISEKRSHFSFADLPLAKGMFSLTVKENKESWIVSAKSKNIQLQHFSSFIKKQQPAIDEISNGLVNADVKLTGTKNELKSVLINSIFKQVSFQAEQGRIAAESLGFDFDLIATKNDDEWNWKQTNFVRQGEVYKEPVYIEIKEGKGIKTKAEGVMRDGNIIIKKTNINSPNVADINIEGIIKQSPSFEISEAKIHANIKDLDYFSTHYLSTLLEQTAFESIKLKGQLELNLALSESAIKQISSQFSNLTIVDSKQRIELVNSQGKINWSDDINFTTPSNIQWDQLSVRTIPIDAGDISLLLNQQTIKLLKSSSIPFLGGVLSINNFNWQHHVDDEPTVYFAGGVKNVSLEQLSNALGWNPLTGNISGYIPGVEYKNKVLKVNGDLNVDVFDGTININNLASSGLLTDTPKFYMDMSINNLDLHAITQKLEMGGIEGRLSGYVNNLYLENWEPVTFYAWFGTPENDDSRHRISQKAVENIASIGGGGAADVISKGFLRFFDTFGYDRLGFGCYLYQGVCQLMGVEAAEQGYYIIKGGGLPRIDVIGYNPRVDWKVLIKRLSRLSGTDNLIVE